MPYKLNEPNVVFEKPDEMRFQGNLAKQLKNKKQKFTNFLVALEKDGKEDKYKTTVLLNLIEDEGNYIFITFKF